VMGMLAPRLALVTGLWLAASATPALADADVNVGDDFFSPTTVSIGSGQTVTWHWIGFIGNHSVTVDSGQSESFDSDPGTTTPQHAAGFTFSHTFPGSGRFTYHCKVHAFMTGTVIVGSGVAPPDTVPPTLSGARLSPTRLCTKRSASCPHPGTKLTFRLSEKATVRARVLSGRHTVKRLRFSGRKGRNSFRYSGRGLAPGRYGMKLTATDPAGNSSKVTSLRFRVL
jgi:plastocyanin